MLFKSVLSVVALALSVNAAVIARQDKTFKFQVQDPKRGKLYLGEGGASTADETKALVCTLTADVLKCGGKGFQAYPRGGDMMKLTPGTSSAGGWSIDAQDNIAWKATGVTQEIKFSIGLSGATDVYAETCPHHWASNEHGTAKAVWTTPAA
ncbi:hypothetical protein QBC34DRAFT_379431 [Podospora aff. communis PSN243]|uniref:AA1-like domain-containing protein n=1 Tax=Podospora aff. communis PSN243 TaxID=3040156 RepID=A0AAV9GPQ3_9PEZI|nr:hypothetical protein QBC34DRAFT_379431 [Podospora aff. communis PSN243]